MDHSENKNEQIDRELAFHLEAMTQAKIASGVSPAEARRQAALEFGGVEQVRQQVREVYISAFVESLRTNLLSAMRFARRSPGFALTLIFTLALGIGANSAVFSAIDAIVLQPLPFPHGDELMSLQQHDAHQKVPFTFVSTQRLEDWNRLNSTFQSISGYYTGDATFSSSALPEKLTVAFVAPRFLQVWGVFPALGRDFTSEEQKFGGPNALLVSHRFWLDQLHADPSAAGKQIRLSDSAYTVVGVLPANFRFPITDVDLWEPSPVDAPYSQDRNSPWFTVVGRLRPGVSVAQARADLGHVQQQLGKQYPQSDAYLSVTVQPLKSTVLGGVDRSLWLFYAAVSLLLVIACTNIAALLMARTAEREHEISIRYSLGASRKAIIGQLLTEVFVLALTGSILGLAIAAGAAHVFGTLSKDLPRVEEISLNWRIVAYSLACAFASTLVCGLFPAVRGTRRSLSGSLSHSGRTQVSARNPLQWTLVGVQVSLAVALLLVSGLLLRSFHELGKVNPGFNPDHVLTLRISAGWGETSDMGKLTQRIDRDLNGLRSVPGVEAVATSAFIPGNSFPAPGEFKITERTTDTTQKIVADARYVSAGYFSVLQIPLLQGEACRSRTYNTLPGIVPSDSKIGTAIQPQKQPFNTMVVNRSFAEKYFSGSPIGFHVDNFTSVSFIQPALILGVVGDVREEGLETAAEPTVYWCYSASNPDPYFLVRTYGDPKAMADTLRRKIHELEPSRSVFGVLPLENRLEDRQAESRLRTILLASFALTAILLVSLGLYGTISYLGRTRRREVGLRLALGALPHQIVTSFVLLGLRVSVVGCCIGLAVGAMLSHLLTGMLYGISPLDPYTYISVLFLTLLVALAALLFPSLRAARVDPTEMLRQE